MERSNVEKCPKRKSIMEQMVDEERGGIIRKKDADGVIHEWRYETVDYVPEGSNTIPMKTLMEIVSDVKKLMNEPDSDAKLRRILRGL